MLIGCPHGAFVKLSYSRNDATTDSVSRLIPAINTRIIWTSVIHSTAEASRFNGEKWTWWALPLNQIIIDWLYPDSLLCDVWTGWWCGLTRGQAEVFTWVGLVEQTGLVKASLTSREGRDWLLTSWSLSSSGMRTQDQECDLINFDFSSSLRPCLMLQFFETFLQERL